MFHSVTAEESIVSFACWKKKLIHFLKICKGILWHCPSGVQLAFITYNQLAFIVSGTIRHLIILFYSQDTYLAYTKEALAPKFCFSVHYTKPFKLIANRYLYGHEKHIVYGSMALFHRLGFLTGIFPWSVKILLNLSLFSEPGGLLFEWLMSTNRSDQCNLRATDRRSKDYLLVSTQKRLWCLPGKK